MKARLLALQNFPAQICDLNLTPSAGMPCSFSAFCGQRVKSIRLPPGLETYGLPGTKYQTIFLRTEHFYKVQKYAATGCPEQMVIPNANYCPPQSLLSGLPIYGRTYQVSCFGACGDNVVDAPSLTNLF